MNLSNCIAVMTHPYLLGPHPILISDGGMNHLQISMVLVKSYDF